MAFAKTDKFTFLDITNKRTKKIYINVINTLIIKGGSILVNLSLIPLTINCVDPIRYGVWLTISSVISWMSFFDVGLGNGLRNKLTHTLAVEQIEEGKKYVSTTYAVIGIISIAVFIVFSLVNPLIEWKNLLNIPVTVTDDMNLIIQIVISSFCLQLILQIINPVLNANHEPSLVSVITLLSQITIWISIYFLKETGSGTLTNLVSVLTTIPIVILLMASIIFYNGKLSIISPSFNSINLKYTKSLINVGGVFFFLQIGALVLFQTNNIIISKIINPKAVTEFNIAFKLYSVVTIIFGIVITPYWSAFTDAYAKKEYNWMKKNLKRIRVVWFAISIIVVPVVYILSSKLYALWVGTSVIIPQSLSAVMGLYVIGQTGMMLNCYFLNGIGKLRLQLYLYVAVCVINVPLSIYLGKKFGTTGVASTGVIIFFVMGILLWIQSTKIVNKTATGIWNL